MKARPPSTSGSRGSTTTTSGSVGLDRRERRADVAGTARRPRAGRRGRAGRPGSPGPDGRRRRRRRGAARRPGAAARAVRSSCRSSPTGVAAERPPADGAGTVVATSALRHRPCADRSAVDARRVVGAAATGRRPVASPRPFGDGTDLDRGPLPGRRHREPAADPLGAGAHPGEPEVAVRDRSRVEPLAVVGTAQARRSPAVRPSSTAHLARGRVLDDVVERLLGDPVEDRPRRRAAGARRGRRSRRRSGSPIRPSSAAACVRSAWIRPSCSRLPGRSSKMSARISASASRCRSRSSRELRLRRLPGRGRAAARPSRDTSVIENSAWVTESCSSRARCARSSPAASSAGLAAQVALEPLALALQALPLAQVADRPVGAREAPSTVIGTAEISVGNVRAVGVPEHEAQAEDGRRVRRPGAPIPPRACSMDSRRRRPR